MIDGSLQERLKRHFQPQKYQRIESAGIVSETQKDGEARVECCVPAGVEAIQSFIEGGSLFGVLKSGDAADGAFLLHVEDGTAELHVIECKKTINLETWAKAKRQMRGSIVRLHMLASVLGLPVSRAFLYTAFRSDELSAEFSSDPALMKLLVGGDDLSADEIETQSVLRGQYDWLDPSVRIDGLERSLPHTPVALDGETGEGTLELLASR